MTPSVISELYTIRRNVRGMLSVLTNGLIRPLTSKLHNLQVLPSGLSHTKTTMRVHGIIRRLLRFLELMPALRHIRFRLLPRTFRRVLPYNVRSVRHVHSTLLTQVSEFPCEFPCVFPICAFYENLSALFMKIQVRFL